MVKEGLSRRGFLKGAGIGALTAAGAGAGVLSGCSPERGTSGRESSGQAEMLRRQAPAPRSTAVPRAN